MASGSRPTRRRTPGDILAETATVLQPAFAELQHHAAHGEVLHNDDTSLRVLAQRRDIDASTKRAADRTGIFTSGIVATREGHRMALFFTGRNHAGENLATILAKRSTEAPPPIQMSDALARNVPELPPNLQGITANCLAHAWPGLRALTTPARGADRPLRDGGRSDEALNDVDALVARAHVGLITPVPQRHSSGSPHWRPERAIGRCSKGTVRAQPSRTIQPKPEPLAAPRPQEHGQCRERVRRSHRVVLEPLNA